MLACAYVVGGEGACGGCFCRALVDCFTCVCMYVCSRQAFLFLHPVVFVFVDYTQEKKKDEAVDGDDSAKDKKDKKKKVIVGVCGDWFTLEPFVFLNKSF